MLHFNPAKRITITEALRHPYLAQFHNPKEETSSKKAITPPVSDNKKLNLKQYKQLIYDRIKKIYVAEQVPETPTVIEYKKSASSIHRATEVLREKHYDHRQSFNSYKSAKMSASHSKYHHPSPSSSYHYSAFNEEEK
jgi:serine/threonine protein kinase